MKRAILFLLFFNVIALHAAKQSREDYLVEHVKKCINLAEQRKSKINKEILKLEGMSSPKVRHFLNNVCSMPKTSYMEIGVWKGSTWISALYGNKDSLAQAVAIDNWSGFGGPISEFVDNCTKFLLGYKYHFYSIDSFKLNKKEAFEHPVNIYFYDGDHSALAQEKAFTYFNDILDDVFIAVIDDWNFPAVPVGTQTAFDKLNYQVIFDICCPAAHNGDIENWWNGLYIAVIKK